MAQHKHADVLRAIADGKAAQWQSKHDGSWSDTSINVNPISSGHLNWRIKPEPKPDVVWYGVAFLPEMGIARVGSLGPFNGREDNNIKLTFDGETGALKSAEVLK